MNASNICYSTDDMFPDSFTNVGCKDSMTDDILYRHRTMCNNLMISFSNVKYNEALIIALS